MEDPLLDGIKDVESGLPSLNRVEDGKRRKKIAFRRKNLILALMFLVTTATSIYSAIKCVLYNTDSFSDDVYSKVFLSLLAAQVFWSSLEVRS
jgi:hypothetical protein